MSLLDALLLEGVRLNFWVAARTDGIAGSGSQTDPFNASGGQFDAVMVKILSLPEAQNASIAIHLGPGTFVTKGYRTTDETSLSGWQIKKGMKIMGSGINVTTIQLTGANVPWIIPLASACSRVYRAVCPIPENSGGSRG